MSALDTQVGGNHYKKYKYQPIEYFVDARLNFISSNIVKYVLRHRDKNGLEDLEKAMQYAKFGIEFNISYRNLTETIREHHDKFMLQIDESLNLERNVLEASARHDYPKCVNLIDELIKSVYVEEDNFDYIGSLQEYAKNDGLYLTHLTSGAKCNNSNHIYVIAFVFVLHKYDVLLSDISNSMRIKDNRTLELIDRGYNYLNKNYMPFLTDVNAMFKHIENERKCKKQY